MTLKAVRAIQAFTGILNPKTWGPFVETFERTRFDHAFDISWSQGGEDIGLLMALRNIPNGRYLDVGAHHPSRFSVTRLLSQHGWCGVNVEANPNLVSAFEKERKQDINLWFCVGTEKEYSLSIFEEPALSTVNPDWKIRFESENQKVASIVQVPGVSLEELFRKYFENGFPDLLCIDAEGSDLNVIQSANLSLGTGPEWILLEADPPLRKVVETPAVAHVLELGYEIHLVMGMSTLLHRK